MASGRVILTSGELYNTIITLLGLVMIFFFVMRFLIGFLGNYLTRLMVGGIDMSLRRLNNISY
jgi:heme/copper-type cytochrome/quinol oxidase subunit 1